ncbi:hypothetical protein RI049_21555 [Cedecea neteri]|uniref:hypothetical protein n=1 Tax=Cedecea neteri TaxID=158822 RepID=UPI002AA954F7|nr:hypothetical protein [Cedecea neteri]WPU22585.1 hypothetical protein RI049_21555 [Cedecea neteri]
MNNKLKLLILLLCPLSFGVSAKMVQNTKAVETYSKQLDETQRILKETQETLSVSHSILEMYKNLGYMTPEVVAVSRHFIQLEEDSKKLYGDNLIMNPTPFSSCVTLPSAAYNFWQAKLSALKNNNADVVNSLGQSYIKQGKECVDAIKNPPPKMIEENDNLEIIDVDTP